MGSWGLLLHSITACLYAVFFQDYVTKLIGLKRSYQLGLGIFSVSMAVTVLNTSSLTTLNLAAAASGAVTVTQWPVDHPGGAHAHGKGRQGASLTQKGFSGSGASEDQNWLIQCEGVSRAP